MWRSETEANLSDILASPSGLICSQGVFTSKPAFSPAATVGSLTLGPFNYSIKMDSWGKVSLLENAGKKRDLSLQIFTSLGADSRGNLCIPVTCNGKIRNVYATV